MSNILPTASKIHTRFPIIEKVTRTLAQTSPIECALAAIVVGSTSWAMYSAWRNAGPLQLPLEPLPLPSGLMSILASHLEIPEIRPVVSLLRSPNDPNQIIQNALSEQIKSRQQHGNMTYQTYQEYAQEHAPGAIFQNIHNLDLQGAVINDAQLQEIIRKCPNLKILNLHNCRNITNTGLLHLKGLRLERLDLSWCDQISDAGLLHLQGLPLEHLNLSSCHKITDAGLVHLQEFPLNYLDLSDCYQRTDAGLVHLQKLPLKYLHLGHCHKITDAGLLNLQGLPLECLHLNSCAKITDAGLLHLQGLPLKELRLGCAQITQAAIYQLNKLQRYQTRISRW